MGERGIRKESHVGREYYSARSSARRAQKSNSPFFLNSGFPFFTDPRQKSPTQAAGRRFCLVPHRVTAIIFKFFAPLLSPH